MIAVENEFGDLDLKITAGLFELIAEHLGNDDRAAVCFFLERLALRTAVRLERLAGDDPDFAREFLQRATAC